MKRTEYFATIEEANQYYPDGVPSSVIAIVGDGSQVLVSSDNAATNTQQYYNADLTNDEIVSTMVQNSYDAGETAGYNTGYTAGETDGYADGYAEGVADGQAEAATNWLDVLFLDEKAKAEQALNVSTWTGDAIKYNFAIDGFDGSCVNPQTAPGLIAGVLQDATISKVIKISKDQNDNAVITYHNCYTNFDGTNLGSFELDSNTYNTKMCIWSEPLTLAVDDEVIWDVAASISGTSMMLFGGYDPDAYEMVEEEGQTYKQWKAATYKCTTAGTYTFGMIIDVPQAQDPQAIAFVSTAFNYTGSATVTAVTVPTGEPSSGSSEPTPEELDQQAYLYFTQGPGYENRNEVMNYVATCGNQVNTLDGIDATLFRSYLDDALTFNNLDFPYNIYTTLYDPTQTPEFQWGTFSGYLQPSFNYSTDPNTGAPIVTMTFTASNNSKIGFGLLPLKYDNDITVDTNLSISTFLKCFDNGETDDWGYAIYRHLTDVEAGNTYTATFTVIMDPETGVDMPSITLQEVQS